MNSYSNPLNERYASGEMKYIFSPLFKFRTWRKLWFFLAKAEKQLGVEITDTQIEELEKHLEDIDFEFVAKTEAEVRHDVMAHIKAFAHVAPKAAPIIHLGATSCYVGDNTDLIQIKEGLLLLQKRLINLISLLSDFALKYKNLPTLGFTHFQPAQLTTVGKRACLWLQDFLLDFQEMEYRLEHIPFRGVKGTTGTQASYLELLQDPDKVKRLDEIVSDLAGFKKTFSVCGQTYPRKLDSMIINLLAGLASSASKFSYDMRILQGLKEIEEPFEKQQVGSSAMAYKRNPMRSERITALSRFLISLSLNPTLTHATQWFERTLDDSANRRLTIGQSFLACDSILILMSNVVNGLVVNERIIERHVYSELPFMATENILMNCVQSGGNRQKIHEVIRKHSLIAAANVKQHGLENNLLELLAKAPEIPLNITQINEIIRPELFIGLAPSQVSDFINKFIKPLLKKYHFLFSDQLSNKINV
jgi:adenylosuccinate lyase